MERGLDDFFAALRAAHADPPVGGTPGERLGWFLQRTSEVFVARQEFLRLHLILILSAEAAEAEVGGTIEKVRREGRELMNHMVRESFLDKGPAVAQEIADRLDHFGIAGFDGAFIAMQADPKRLLPAQNQLLAESMVLLGEAIAEQLAAGAARKA
jgi:hypothetical protein